MLNELPLVPTLIVGGEHSFVVDKLEGQLRRHGLTVAHHWEWGKKPKAFVGWIDVVFIVTDMVSHSLTDNVRELAHERGVPVIFGCRKWATNRERLEKAGFPEREVLATPSPVEEVGPPQVIPPTEEKQDVNNTLPYDLNKLTEIYRGILTEDRDISNAAAYRKAKKLGAEAGINPGRERPDVLAQIRKELGILSPKNSHSKPAPTVATVPASVVPLVVRAATPAAVKPPDAPSKDVKELVQLLRVAMETEGIERLTITKDAVSFRRVVVEEGMFDVG